MTVAFNCHFLCVPIALATLPQAGWCYTLFALLPLVCKLLEGSNSALRILVSFPSSAPSRAFCTKATKPCFCCNRLNFLLHPSLVTVAPNYISHSRLVTHHFLRSFHFSLILSFVQFCPQDLLYENFKRKRIPSSVHRGESAM